MSTNNKINKLSNDLFPNVLGFENIKKVLTIQLFSKKKFSVAILSDTNKILDYFFEDYNNNLNIIKHVKLPCNSEYLISDDLLIVKFPELMDYENLNSLQFEHRDKANIFLTTSKYGGIDLHSIFSDHVKYDERLDFGFNFFLFAKRSKMNVGDKIVIDKIIDEFEETLDFSKQYEINKQQLTETNSINPKFIVESKEKINYIISNFFSQELDVDVRLISNIYFDVDILMNFSYSISKILGENTITSQTVKLAWDVYIDILVEIGIIDRQSEIEEIDMLSI